MTTSFEGGTDHPRPLPATYWIDVGRLLVGEHPASRSRADAMERLRRFLAAGVTCFVDLTEPDETSSYEELLPHAAPDGRPVEYLRAPIPDHGVPERPEFMARLLAAIDDALAAGHIVYVHCRAGIGRSATVAGCWLASRPGSPADPLERLHECWQQSVRSRAWPTIPETDEQADFVRSWAAGGPRLAIDRLVATRRGAPATREQHIRGALLGLAAGDALGASAGGVPDSACDWTQHTSLTLCLAESLLEVGRFDARDQIERYLRWRREGHLAPNGRPVEPSPDIGRALATYLWRHLPLAGSHDPRDRSPNSLPRVVAAVAFELADPGAAVALAAECSRTTHQSPVVLDCCRFYAALLCGALRGEPAADVLRGLYEPSPGLWAQRPLRPEVAALVGLDTARPWPESAHGAGDVVYALWNARAAVAGTSTFEAAVQRAVGTGRETALHGALAGTLAGALYGPDAIPSAMIDRLPKLELIESIAVRLHARGAARGVAIDGAAGRP